jgi:hypothetical protein
MPRAETTLSWALAFVVAWFGLNEIFAPAEWVTFAPAFLGDGTLALDLVVLHGTVLTVCALMLVLNYHRAIAGAVLTLIFCEVVLGLLTTTGLSDIAVRDIGLLGASLSLALLTRSQG